MSNSNKAGRGPLDGVVRPDPERAEFEAWARKRWGAWAYLHCGDTSGEWDAWQAATRAAMAAAEVARLQAEYAKSERRAIVFGDLLHKHILVMRAAVVDGHLRSHAHGLQWIHNTLAGPGQLPDLDEAKALGGAQALFDKEVAEQETFRAAHPAP